ncbi:MAG: hypothetical protein HRU30_08875 [Rhodobacteraceae bacterium]|nr:hypothetical protein [Paracoccaceae bacterium]
MHPLRKETWPEARPEAEIAPEAMAFVNHLRFVAMACRVKPRQDLFHACALLQTTRSASQEAHAEALMRCLDQALGKKALLYAPGVTTLTFDEQWLMQLGLASARQDSDSVSFLLASRVNPEHRRLVRFLAARISEHFSLN